MSTDTRTDRLPLVPGAVAGVVSWLLGYLFTYVLTASDIRDSPVRQFIQAFGGDLPVWRVVGWVFFNAHFVPTNFEGFFGGARSFIGGEGGFTPLLYVVPPLLLFAAGLAVGRASGVREALEDSVRAGLAVVPAYFLLSALGIVLFAVEGAAPDTVAGLFLAGLVYPAVFGVIGAVVAGRT